MRTIEVLSAETVNQIAAGEVVERPASVVKELMENAIDASATAVTVEVRDGGISLIRITDNGYGIPEDQIRLAFTRHATSKIRQIRDLVQISSLGFRGEALSSIAAVSQVELITKTPDALTGVRYCIEGGEEKSMEEIGAPSGTTFLVRHLFFNTPARAKFLRTPTTEGNRVAAVVEELALSHPDVSVKFIMNGQNRLYTSGNGNLKEIIYQIYGRELAKELIPVDQETEYMHVRGMIGNPSVARGNRNFENYFINGRYVKSNLISRAIEDAYHGFLMQHRYPFTLLYIEIDGAKVDVNVHPSKMEVRISNQEDVYHQICLMLQNALLERERIPQVSLEEEKKRPAKAGSRLPVLDRSAPEPFESRRRDQYSTKQGDFLRPSDTGEKDVHEQSMQPLSGVSEKQKNLPGQSGQLFLKTTENRESAQEEYAHNNGMHTGVPEEVRKSGIVRENSSAYQSAASEATPAAAESASAYQAARKTASSEATPAAAESASACHSTEVPEGAAPKQMELFEQRLLDPKSRTQHRIIGQIFDTYWLVEFGDALYIIDQHAAHEKVNYERMMKAYREKKINSQLLYPAIIVTVTAQESDTLREHMDAFTDFGFEIEPFGGNSYKISAVPDNLYSVANDALFRDILDQLGEAGDVRPDLIPERLASMSCKAAVKGNMHLSVQEAEALIDELLTLENPYNCPHGRPTIISMSHRELDKKFKRIL